MTGLSVPDVAGMDTLAAAFAYAKGGWYIGPVRCGSVLSDLRDTVLPCPRDPRSMRNA